MKINILLLTGAVTLAALTNGCSTSTQNVDTRNDTAAATGGLDYRDFDKAASEMLDSLIKSHRLVKRDGGRYIMIIGKIKNDTQLIGISTDQLMWKIKEELTNSGSVAISSAVGSEENVDENIHGVRELRNDAEFNQSGIAGRGSLIAPDLSISGKIFQKNVTIEGASRAEYYFQLKISDLKTGLDFWQKQVLLVKQGDSAKMRLQQL
jgi:uncharacterized protein (TIGR02722 family)